MNAPNAYPKSLRLFQFEWMELQQIAQHRGISRHKLMTEAMRQILNSQSPDVA